MSIFVLKSKEIESMMVGNLGIKSIEGIYIEVEEDNIEEKYRMNKLGGYAVNNGNYMRSNTSGITYGKYFKKIAEPLNFEPIKKEKLNLLNDNSIKFNLVEVIKILEDTDNNSSYLINFNKVEDGKFSVEFRRLLDNNEIIVQKHEFKEFESSFRGMYSFEVKLTLGYLNFENVMEIRNMYSKNRISIDLEQLKKLIKMYDLKVVGEDDKYIKTSYRKIRTSFTGRNLENDINRLYEKNQN